MSQEKVINHACQRLLYWLDYPLRSMEAFTNSKTLTVVALMYVNDYIILDKQLFIHTIDVRKCIAIMSIITLPLLATVFPPRPPPYAGSFVGSHGLPIQGIIENKSLYETQHSFPCINVMNCIILTRYLVNTPMVASMMVLLTSMSCVYCGTHFMSDTFFGYLFGMLGVSGLECLSSFFQ